MPQQARRFFIKKDNALYQIGKLVYQENGALIWTRPSHKNKAPTYLKAIDLNLVGTNRIDYNRPAVDTTMVDHQTTHQDGRSHYVTFEDGREKHIVISQDIPLVPLEIAKPLMTFIPGKLTQFVGNTRKSDVVFDESKDIKARVLLFIALPLNDERRITITLESLDSSEHFFSFWPLSRYMVFIVAYDLPTFLAAPGLDITLWPAANLLPMVTLLKEEYLEMQFESIDQLPFI